jgi:hypothetical protein
MDLPVLSMKDWLIPGQMQPGRVRDNKQNRNSYFSKEMNLSDVQLASAKTL